jgi:hypothetical protein
MAAGALRHLAANNLQHQAAITGAGAVPLLVELLGPDSWGYVQLEAAWALCNLAANNAQCQASIDAAGAIFHCWLSCWRSLNHLRVCTRQRQGPCATLLPTMHSARLPSSLLVPSQL